MKVCLKVTHLHLTQFHAAELNLAPLHVYEYTFDPSAKHWHSYEIRPQADVGSWFGSWVV